MSPKSAGPAILFSSLSLMGCLEGGQRLSTPASAPPAAEVEAEVSEAFARASGALETGETSDTAVPDEAALLLCADDAYACLEGGQVDPSACLDTYIACAVGTGIPADNGYLVCLDGLSGCWREVGSVDEADVCYATYDGCLVDLEFALENGDEDEAEEVRPDEPSNAIEACAYAADDCLMALSETDAAGQAACVVTYSECLVEAGVSTEEPYLGCLADTTVCLNEGTEAVDTCWYFFQVCYDENYPTDEVSEPDPSDDHDNPDDSWGESPCEQETMACYDDGGSNVTCLGVLRSCLLRSGVPEDHPYIECLDPLIGCVGPAESSTDPDTALGVCSDTFNQCVDSSAH